MTTPNRGLASIRQALARLGSRLRRIPPSFGRPPRDPWTLAPLNRAYRDYRDNEAAGRPVPETSPRLIEPRLVAHARGHQPAPPPDPPQLDGICSFPPSYDRRKLGTVTPAWTTGKGCGACWTSAALGSLESVFAPQELRDFSEAHMALKNGWFDNEDPKKACGMGGNPDLATFYLAAWRGPVNESDFDPNVPTSTPPTVAKHVQNIYYLPNRTGPLDNCWIKLAVMHLGGVYSAMGKGWGFNPGHPTYYDPTNDVIHAVTIVGWDDHFDRTKFHCNNPKVPESQRVPPADGAWIVKDNAGPNAWEDGFLYVSYYDGSIGTTMAVYTGEPLGNYTRAYQYDPHGVTRTMYLAFGGGTAKFSYQGNIFTAAEQESLEAVGFYELVQAETDYQILVYLDPDNGPVRSSGPVATVNVSLLLCGYYTVRLPKTIPLKKGQRFGIVLKGRERPGGWPSAVAVEAPLLDLPITAHAGESFVSVDGVDWKELTTLEVPVSANVTKTMTNSNLCIKAFTRGPVHVSDGVVTEAQVMKWVVTNEGSEPIRVHPVARRDRRTRAGFEPLGPDVLAESYEDAEGARHPVLDGWIDVPPRATVTAFSPRGAMEAADRITYNAYLFDRASNQVLVPGFWKYVTALIDQPPVVTSTDPASNAKVNAPGLTAVHATFDRAITLGPAGGAITFTSANESKVTMPMVSGKELTILLATPLTSKELGGTLWKVTIPATAVLEATLGHPMTQDYSWTFTVTGPN
jgi:C1A family cysteine protease